MIKSLAVSFLVGVILGNGLPHFIKGLSQDNLPCKIGNGPLPNFLAGWASLVLIGLLYQLIDVQKFAVSSLIAGYVGLLFIGLLHSSGALDRFKLS